MHILEHRACFSEPCFGNHFRKLPCRSDAGMQCSVDMEPIVNVTNVV